jgi:hypothetical protein
MPGTVAMRMLLSPPSRKMARFATPHNYPGVGGEALAEFVKALWTAFPDFHIELLNGGEIEPGLVAIPGYCGVLIPAKESRVRPQDEASQSAELRSLS